MEKLDGAYRVQGKNQRAGETTDEENDINNMEWQPREYEHSGHNRQRYCKSLVWPMLSCLAVGVHGCMATLDSIPDENINER